jgi:hypothetical protein
MSELMAYMSYIMWQAVIFYNYIIRTLTIIAIIFKETYFVVLYNYYPPDDIVFIENSMIKFGCRYNTFYQSKLSSFDYCVFNHKIDNRMLKKIVTSIEDIPIHSNQQKNLSLVPKPCNFQFIMVLFKTGEDSFDVTNILNNIDNFYYIQNSILFDKNFIDWICLKHLLVNLTDITVVILDNNATEITITPNQCIKLGTNGYTVEIIS